MLFVGVKENDTLGSKADLPKLRMIVLIRLSMILMLVDIESLQKGSFL
jgi:hypothetical protein